MNKTVPLPLPVVQLLERFAQNGQKAWAVGGAVRDSLLGRTPGDWDLCTTALPPQIMQLFNDCTVIPTGLAHGTVTVVWQGSPYEITTLRAETGYADCRHPNAVRFVGELSADLARRDFTVNAMACGIDGRVVDDFGGKADLAAQRIRCVGEPAARFGEDALRILRALRFAAQLDFSLSPQTAAAARAQKELLKKISAERIYAELDKLLSGRAAARVLAEYPDILAVVIPEIAPCVGFSHHKPEFFSADVWQHTVQAFGFAQSLPGAQPPDPPDRLVLWALLLHDLGKPKTFTMDEHGVGWCFGHEAESAVIARRVLCRLRADKKTQTEVCTLVRYHGEVPKLTPAEALLWLHRFGPATAHRLLQVKRCDLQARIQNPKVLSFLRELQEFSALLQTAESTGCWRLDQLAVSGSDLLQNGFSADPALGQVLQTLLQKVMAGELPNQKAALLAAAKQEKTKNHAF